MPRGVYERSPEHRAKLSAISASRTGEKGARYRPLADRFWEKVNKDGPVPEHRPELGPCWLWTGSGDGKGYGKIKRNGKMVRVTHIAIELDRGTLVPVGIEVMHHCDNPPCVNVRHLVLGTHDDNMRDLVAKERQAKAFSAADVQSIRARCAAGDSQSSLARDFGVTPGAINAIVLKKHYRWV